MVINSEPSHKCHRVTHVLRLRSYAQGMMAQTRSCGARIVAEPAPLIGKRRFKDLDKGL